MTIQDSTRTTQETAPGSTLSAEQREAVRRAAATAWQRHVAIPPTLVAVAARAAIDAAIDATAELVREQTLREAYWKLRRRARDYRQTRSYLAYQDDAKTPGASTHVRIAAAQRRSFAHGIAAVGEDIAEMLGVPEHEIDDEAEEARTDG